MIILTILFRAAAFVAGGCGDGKPKIGIMVEQMSHDCCFPEPEGAEKIKALPAIRKYFVQSDS